MVKNRKIIPFLNCEGETAAAAVACSGINALVIWIGSGVWATEVAKWDIFSNFNFSSPHHNPCAFYSIFFRFTNNVPCTEKKNCKKREKYSTTMLCRNFIDFYITLYFISIVAFLPKKNFFRAQERKVIWKFHWALGGLKVTRWYD